MLIPGEKHDLSTDVGWDDGDDAMMQGHVQCWETLFMPIVQSAQRFLFLFRTGGGRGEVFGKLGVDNIFTSGTVESQCWGILGRRDEQECPHASIYVSV
jgi:hypothetical protein